ncbi:hypothetical protein DL96DRAFT_1577307 [Flagelloscypha sp. PMI_526]|nr:hypothetical protein DL96DRAFT_1577307 [Flagelloscypha sp. PMI_526]
MSFVCLPSEIHHLILSYLLSFGGSDALHVSELNRYFHQVSKPYTLHNVKLVTQGREKEPDIAISILKQIQGGGRPIENLFFDLSCLAGENYDYIALGRTLVMTLRAASATLETLFVTIPRIPNICHSLERSITEEIDWPKLRRLCIVGWHFASTPAEADEPLSQRCPRLTHIHLVSPPVAHMVLQEGRCSRVWPNMTHLRLSNCTSGVVKLHLLGTALNNVIQRWKNEEPSQELVEFGFVPESTTRILVQRPKIAAQPKVTLPHTDAMDELESLQGGKNGKLTGGKCVEVYSADEYTMQDMNRDWLDCVAGGLACWQQPDQNSLQTRTYTSYFIR